MLELNAVAMELMAMRESEVSQRRKDLNEGRLIMRLQQILEPTIRKMARRKNMQKYMDEMEQVSSIAILQASKEWDPEISSFSTFVHWRLRAESKNLELSLFPERRKVCDKIDVKVMSLNAPSKNYDGDYGGECGDSFTADQFTEDNAEVRVENYMNLKTIETSLIRHVAVKMKLYYKDKNPRILTIHNMMRDINIYYRNKIDGYTTQTLGGLNGVTRERIRQVSLAIEKIIQKNYEEMQSEPRPKTQEENQLWLDALAIYKDKADVDIRIFRDEMRTALWNNEQLSAMDVLPSMMEVDERKSCYLKGMTFEEMGIRKPRRSSESPREHKMAEVVIGEISSEIAKAKRKAEELKAAELKAAKKAIIAGNNRTNMENIAKTVCGLAVTLLMGTEAVSAQTQSRAIPPESSVMAEPMIANDNGTARNETGSPAEIIVVEDERTWVVKLSGPLRYDEHVSTARDMRRKFADLEKLKLVHIPRDNGKTIAFGPLDERGAKRICRRLQIKEQKCAMIRLSSKLSRVG